MKTGGNRANPQVRKKRGCIKIQAHLSRACFQSCFFFFLNGCSLPALYHWNLKTYLYLTTRLCFWQIDNHSSHFYINGLSYIMQSQLNVVYFDLSAVFDLIDRRISISKLSHYDVCEQTLTLLKSNQLDREGFVRADHLNSTTYKINSGVPQGPALAWSPPIF